MAKEIQKHHPLPLAKVSTTAAAAAVAGTAYDSMCHIEPPRHGGNFTHAFIKDFLFFPPPPILSHIRVDHVQHTHTHTQTYTMRWNHLQQ